MNKKLFLFDIEGTTTDIHFVHQTLFPYSFERIDYFVKNNLSKISNAIEKAKLTILEETNHRPNLEEIILGLKSWITSDRKHPSLKEIQGHIWEEGYLNGDFKGHLYGDVLPFFNKIKNKNFEIGIYSSGSVNAQKLLFKYSCEGDLTKYISFYFDTQVGQKKEYQSYERISQESKFEAEEITFFSDIKEELIAAQKAHFNCFQLERYEISPGNFKIIKDFRNFEI